jgi:hypothetical protein
MNEPDDSRKLLLDEYKLVQDKIDKFGAFKFVIRGWAMTVTSAIIAAIATAAILSSAALFVIPVLLLFWALEAYELRTRVLLSSRALRIESALRKTGAAPETAGSLAAGAIGLRKGSWLKWVHDLFYVLLMIIVGCAFAVRYFQRPPAQPARPADTNATISAPSEGVAGTKPHSDMPASSALPTHATSSDVQREPSYSKRSR